MTSTTIPHAALSKIHWPVEHDPVSHSIYAVNSIDTSASPVDVWRLLVGARDWQDYYPNANNVDISDGSAELAADSKFTWTTAGVKLNCTVREYVPFKRISWDALYEESSAYHGWLIEPTEAGTHILTEETQHGPFWEKIAAEHPGILHRFHQQWVEALAEAASARVAAA
jgi:hypothetical protein